MNPKLDPANVNSLIAGISHPNLFWRIQAQRLPVESGSPTAAEKLKERLKTSSSRQAALHTIYTLHAVRALDAETVKIALASPDRRLFRAGLLNAPADDTLADAVIHDGIIKAPDTRLLTETLVALSTIAPSGKIGKALHATLVADKDLILADAALNDAWQIAARHHAAGSDSRETTSSVPVNLLPDPGFDSTKLGPWSLRPYLVDRPSSVEIAIAPGGRNGGSALKITSPSRADAGAGISVQPNTRYRLGGWVETEDFENKSGRGAMLNVHGSSATAGVTGTNNWTEVSMEFNSGIQSMNLDHCLFGGYGGGTGTAWYDDLYLNEIGTGDVSGAIDSVAKYFADNDGSGVGSFKVWTSNPVLTSEETTVS